MKPRELGASWAWLRLFLPSWKFFEDFRETPRLFFRVAAVPGRFGPWQEACPPTETRPWTVLFLNPQGNLRLANLGAVDRLLDEAARRPFDTESESSVSLRLIENIVRERLPAAAVEFQFKIGLEQEDLLISAPLKTDVRA